MNREKLLNVDFCGLKFPNPFLLSSAPPTTTGEMMEKAYRAGWGGAVTKTLALEKEEVVNVSPRLHSLAFESGGDEPRKLYGLENIELITDRPLGIWLDEITHLVKAFPEHVTIASIMADASLKEDWQLLASRCEKAGAMALELNFSCPHGMPDRGMGAAIGQHPELVERITGWVRSAVRIPILVKLTPNITDISLAAQAAKKGGADALSAINTVSTLIGINLDTLEPMPSVRGNSAYGGYSGPAVKPIALRCVSEIAKATGLPISGIGGISSWKDAAEFILVGATTLQVCTAVMVSGIEIITDLKEGLMNYMEDKGFSSISQMSGKVLPKLNLVSNLDKSYKVVSSIDTSVCVKCDLCYKSCRDGGYQAISLDEQRIPHTDEEKCTGCSLCMQVCPVWDCVTMKKVEPAAV